MSRRYATAPFELWHLTLEDTIETTGRAFLGLTLRCARCHDHKFDPVSQRDYYALYGIFASTTFPYAGSEELQSKAFPRLNFVPLVEPAFAEPKLKAYHERIEKLEGIDQVPRIEERPSIAPPTGGAGQGADATQAAIAAAGSSGQLCSHRRKAGRRGFAAAG